MSDQMYTRDCVTLFLTFPISSSVSFIILYLSLSVYLSGNLHFYLSINLIHPTYSSLIESNLIEANLNQINPIESNPTYYSNPI